MDIKLLVHGYPGVGKTCLLGSIVDVPELNPALFVDLESGTMSINSKLETRNLTDDDATFFAPPAKGKMVSVRVTDWSEMSKLLDRLYEVKDPVFKSIICDSLTEVNYCSLRNACETNTSSNDPDLATLKDYGKSASQMRNTIRDFRNLPLNIFFAALSQEVKDDVMGELVRKPSLNGKLSDEVSAMMDIVAYLAVEGPATDLQRVAYFQPANRCIAKDRSEGGRLGIKMDNPTMLAIYNCITGKVKG